VTLNSVSGMNLPWLISFLKSSLASSKTKNIQLPYSNTSIFFLKILVKTARLFGAQLQSYGAVNLVPFCLDNPVSLYVKNYGASSCHNGELILCFSLC